jgi:hypothetical protein
MGCGGRQNGQNRKHEKEEMMKATHIIIIAVVVIGVGFGCGNISRGGVQVAVDISPERVKSVEVFYDRLAPHGDWVNIPEYGRVWRPAVASLDPAWRPYCTNGKWVWTSHGWYWQSNYAWGWAPFHFGRWVVADGHGWVWRPDTVWGPAWVHWRRSSTHYGWAPLPPEARYEAGVGLVYREQHVSWGFHFDLTDGDYVFVATDHFLRPDLPSVVVAAPAVRRAHRPVVPPRVVRRVVPRPAPVRRAPSRRSSAVRRLVKVLIGSGGGGSTVSSSTSTQTASSTQGSSSAAQPGSRSQRLRDALR